jgi:hypothetical protein
LDLLARHYLPPAMNGKFLIWGTVLLSVTVLLQACSLQTAPTAGVEPTTTLDSTQLPSVPEATATAASFEDDAQKPTREPAPTVWPPVFDLWSLEDIRSLDSFVVTVNERNTVNGQLTMRTFTIGYIQEPYSAYHVNEYQGGVDRTYVVNDRTYELTGSGDWYISAGKQDGLFSEADPARNAGKLVEARFAGETGSRLITSFWIPPARQNPPRITSWKGNSIGRERATIYSFRIGGRPVNKGTFRRPMR